MENTTTVTVTLQDGRQMRCTATLTHQQVNGRRQTTMSNAVAQIDGGPDLALRGSVLIDTDHYDVRGDAELLRMWAPDHWQDLVVKEG